MTDRLAGQRVLVTGGAGFIGSHLVEGLLAAGAATVRVLDNLSSGSEHNLAAALSDRRLEARLADDIRDPARLRAACSGMDSVVHLAALKHNPSRGAVEELFDTNISGTFRLLEAATAANVKKVVFASSLYAYGLHGRGPFSESSTPLAPRTIYGASKASGEMLLQAYGHRHGIRTAALRYFFVYGPRLYRHHYQYALVPKTLARLDASLPPEIYGDGQQTFDYVFIADAVRATMLALGAEQPSLVLNIGSGQPTTVLELVRLLSREMAVTIDPVFAAPDETAGTYRVGDVEAAKRELGFRAEVPLGEGVRQVVSWWRGLPQSAR